MGKLYVIVRNDLGLAYSGVQAGHALAAWMLENPSHHWKNQTLVYVVVENEQQLKRWMTKLDMRGYEYSYFQEPDINDEYTAIACYTDTGVFKNLPLLGYERQVA